jgi:hypothetical protein
VRRIEVTGEGIRVTEVVEPLLSMYGKEMRPGGTSVHTLPWNEVASVWVYAHRPPDGGRWIYLTIYVTWGEHFEVNLDAEGFVDNVSGLCRLSGLPVPDAGTFPEDGQLIWPGPETA